MKSISRYLLAASLAPALPLAAAVYTWDTVPGDAAVTGGAGDWDVGTTPNWTTDAGATNEAWPAFTSGDDQAVFGGTGGIVTVADGGVTVSRLTFNAAGYTLAGAALNLDGSPLVANGVAATISAPLAGTTGLTKTGDGTLSLSGDNSGLSGPLVISGVSTGTNGGVVVSNTAAFGGLNSVDIQNNGFLRLNGATLGGAVAITVAGGGGTGAPEGAIRGSAGVNVVEGPVALQNSSVRLGNVGGSASTTFNGAVTAPLGSGYGILFRYNVNQGTILTNASNYWEGNTFLASGSVYFHPGALPAASNLIFASSGSSWFETSGTFTRGIGAAAGQVQFNGTAGRVNGMSARGGDLEVNLGGGSPATGLTWGVDGFGPAILGLAGANATGTLNWLNPIDLNGAGRTVEVLNGSAAIDARISGAISGGAGSILTKSGAGLLLLADANSHAGGTVIAASQGAVNPLRISHASALGTGTLTIGGGGNDDRARLELDGDITVANTIAALTSRNSDVPNFFNVAGTNTITANVSSGGGGSRVTLHSESGTMVFTGNIATRQLNLRGEGDGELHGNVPLQAGHGLNKAGGGTWTIRGSATYPGTTTISAGTLKIGAGGTTGTLPAGDVTNNAALVIDRDGTLDLAANIAGSGSLASVGPGTVNLNGATLAWTGPTSIPQGRLNINGNATGATGAVAVGDGDGGNGLATLGGSGTVGGAISVANDGTLAPGLSVGTLTAAGNVALGGTLAIEIDGAAADRLDVAGELDISGALLDVAVLAGGATAPVYVIASYGSLVPAGGPFPAVVGLPGGYTVEYNYNSQQQIALVSAFTDPYEAWIGGFGLAPADLGKDADPDRDGLSNLAEFAFNGNPANPSDNGLRAVLVRDADEPADGAELTLVAAVRRGAVFGANGANASQADIDGLRYVIAGSLDLAAWTSPVSAGSASDTPPAGSGLAADLTGTAWEYRAFVLDASQGLPGTGFLRATVTVP
jgi:autotransporter-associated beta strand protein